MAMYPHAIHIHVLSPNVMEFNYTVRYILLSKPMFQYTARIHITVPSSANDFLKWRGRVWKYVAMYPQYTIMHIYCTCVNV